MIQDLEGEQEQSRCQGLDSMKGKSVVGNSRQAWLRQHPDSTEPIEGRRANQERDDRENSCEPVAFDD